MNPNKLLLLLALTACGSDSDDAPTCVPQDTEISALALDPGMASVFADTSLSGMCEGVNYAAVYALKPDTAPATCSDGTMSMKGGALGFFNKLEPNTKYFMRACVLLPTGELSKGISKEFTTQAMP